MVINGSADIAMIAIDWRTGGADLADERKTRFGGFAAYFTFRWQFSNV